ncbi:ABC transporter ATP-binding protein [Acidimangrovimonas sediminis]|uniref:ABC transporter ATP-binding protein n=1 Tax=Acidimangrovimonas sediminis TaxID=2056283 RepID=UPI0018EB196A|nr:ABC transporter ATP-binding protein [Acidimangrovimonas sediminis]
MQTKPDTAPDAPAPDVPLVSVRNLKTWFEIRGGVLDRMLGRDAGTVKAVDDVTFDLARGEVLGLVGESGSGKSTLGRSLLGLVHATGGSASFEGQEVVGLDEPALRKLRSRMQMVFQDPHAALNPAMTIAQSVGHPLTIHGRLKGRDEIRAHVAKTLERVGLSPADTYMDKYPGDLSGGQKQRAVIARAIVLDPVLLVADEPVSMLDMSVRSKILKLMIDLKDQLGLTYLYITHDLASAKFFCDRIAILYLGKIVEIGEARALYAGPKHPYTEALLGAIPDPDPTRTIPRNLPRGEIPDAAKPPRGCAFHPRCPRAFAPCGWELRDLTPVLEARWAGMEEQAHLAERALIGEIPAEVMEGTTARLPAATPGGGADLLAMLERIRSEDPAEPFWTGIKEMRAEADHVAMEFHPALTPRLYAEGTTAAACHLLDPGLTHPRAAAAPVL